MTRQAAWSLLSWEPVSPRILTAIISSRGRKVHICRCCASTETPETEEKEEIYEQPQSGLDSTRRRDLKIRMGYLSVQVILFPPQSPKQYRKTTELSCKTIMGLAVSVLAIGNLPCAPSAGSFSKVPIEIRTVCLVEHGSVPISDGWATATAF